MLLSAGAKIAKQLCGVFRSESPASFDFDDQFFSHKEVDFKIAQDSAVLIAYLQRNLLLGTNAHFVQSVHQASLVNAFLVPMTQEAMQSEGSLPHLITESEDWIFLRHFFAFLRLKIPHRSHSPITKSSEPRIAGMSETMWPGKSFDVSERLQKEGLRIFRRCGTPPPVE